VESIVGMKNAGSQAYGNSILYSVCNSRNPLLIQNISEDRGLHEARRRTNHAIAAKAYFHKDFRNKEPNDRKGDIDLGAVVFPYGRRTPFTVLVIPFVFTNGVPVGALVIGTISSHFMDTEIDGLVHHENILRAARILYQKRHDVDVATMIRGSSEAIIKSK